MSPITQNIVSMLNMPPEKEQAFACEVVRKLVLAWDPDFTKLTADEARELEAARSGEYISEKDIDWDNLESMELD